MVMIMMTKIMMTINHFVHDGVHLRETKTQKKKKEEELEEEKGDEDDDDENDE